jgi:Zn-dependent protease with chaperone function
MNYVAIVLAILAVSYMRGYDAGVEPVSQNGKEWRFRAGRTLRWVVIGGLGTMFLLGANALFTDRASDQLFGIIFSLAMFPVYLFILPRTIILSAEGLTSRGWFYRRRFSPWRTVSRAARAPGMRQILIYGDDGLIATHTRYHSGRDELVALLRRNRVSVS